MTNSSKWKFNTGTAVSFITEQTFQKLDPELSLQPSHTILKTYTGAAYEFWEMLKYQSSSKANRNS